MTKASSDSYADEALINESGDVLTELLNTPTGISRSILNKAECVIVLPSTKKSGFIVGGTYRRGVMTCRSGENFDGAWSAPIMMQSSGGGLGLLLGGGATDFVILVMNDKGARALLQGKVKLGADASVAPGPVGRKAESNADAAMSAEMLSYSRALGVSGGASLSGMSLAPDDGANQSIYGRRITGKEIFSGSVRPPEEARQLLSALQAASPSNTSGSSYSPSYNEPAAPAPAPAPAPAAPAPAPAAPAAPAPAAPAPAAPAPAAPAPAAPAPAAPAAPATDEEILEQRLSKLKKGNMVYNTPEKMKTGQTAHVTARIASDKVSLQSLVSSLPADQGTTTAAAPTPVWCKMKVTLTGADFAITPLSTELQPVSGDTPTTWEWDIAAKHSGKLRLHLAAIVVWNDISKDFATVDRDIVVQVDPVHESAEFVNENWHWILTTLGAGIAAAWAWWRKRKKSKVPDWQTP
jgi:SH3 domain-containing YSC84-like protein 1